MKFSIARLTILSFCFYLQACSSIAPNIADAPIEEKPTYSARYDDFFGERPELLSVDQIHQLSEPQKADFLGYIAQHRDQPLHIRIADYLQDKTALDFNYSTTTNSATVSLQTMEGNCLSLAILTTALAKLANVDTAYQLMDSAPVFEFNEGVVFKGVHVRTRLYEPASSQPEAVAPLMRANVLIDYFFTGSERYMHKISEPEYIARYYLNTAADAISADDYSKAYWLTLEAMVHDPVSSDAFNHLAVIYKRVNALAKAEEVYLYAIDKLPNKLSLLKNYQLMLNQQQRYVEAEELNQRIDELDDQSPYHWMHAARDEYDRGAYTKAISLYEKAISFAPYLHEAHLGLAQSYYQIGSLVAAEQQLRTALEITSRPRTQSLYQAKLTALARGPL